MTRGSTSPSASSGADARLTAVGIAAGRGDVRVRREVVAVELDEAVREPADDVGGAVGLAVPTGVRVGRKAEVGAEVDDVGDVVEDPGEEVLARAVRQHAEHEVEPAQVTDGERRENGVAVLGRERRVQVGDARARVRGGRDVHDLDLRVAGQQPERLGPRIP